MIEKEIKNKWMKENKLGEKREREGMGDFTSCLTFRCLGKKYLSILSFITV